MYNVQLPHTRHSATSELLLENTLSEFVIDVVQRFGEKSEAMSDGRRPKGTVDFPGSFLETRCTARGRVRERVQDPVEIVELNTRVLLEQILKPPLQLVVEILAINAMLVAKIVVELRGQ